MTKKSPARIARDDLKKNNKCWDELKDIAAKSAQALITVNRNLADIYKTEHLINFIEKKNEVKVTLRGLAGDLTHFSEDLNRIFNTHKDRSGGFTTEEDFAASVTVFEEYMAYQTRYDSVVLPSVQFLMDQAALAEQKIIEAVAKKQEEEKAKELVDPNVISDAVIKN